jgi:2-succinyl-5-enolpyruvyl-6-hydroxy-3-cyclohexene-1-carboxylate synthase
MLNHLWGYLIIEELVRHGCDYLIISPGSRSTPLTVAAARHPQARKQICYDERGAAFQAVGYARATGKPAVLICTSGSAAANYYPAILEAAIECLPLIILSGDRPPELRATGANQTIDRLNLYGSYLKSEFDLPCPTAAIQPQMVLTTIGLLVGKARATPAGVVSLNCMFREPLAPDRIEVAVPASLAKWSASSQPYTCYSHSRIRPDRFDDLVEIINSTKSGLLAIGLLKSNAEVVAVEKLITRLNYPVFPDIRSGLRLSNRHPQIIHYFDRLLLHPDRLDLDIDTVLQIGTRMVSKNYQKWLESHQPNRYLVISEDPDRHDPGHLVSDRIQSDISYFCTELSDRLSPPQSTNPTLDRLSKLNQKLDRSIDTFFQEKEKSTEGNSINGLNEPWICRTITRLLPSNWGLWIGNSMPIRDFDCYGAIDSRAMKIGANRGTSGIEGGIAAAVGFAVGLEAPVTAVLGDLSSLYDLNSLILLKSIDRTVILVIINNNGGGIFSFLPIAQSSDLFEEYFGTPHHLDFSHAAAMFGINYYQPRSSTEFIQHYRQAIAQSQPTMIEVTTNRSENYQIHQQLNQLSNLRV